jgi:hypothetical protein
MERVAISVFAVFRNITAQYAIFLIRFRVKLPATGERHEL